MSTKYDDIIESASKQYNVDADLIKAIITVESNWNPKAFNTEPTVKGDSAWGLMQILLGTARNVSNNPNLQPEELIQPTVNILIGTKYLHDLFKKYNYMDDVIASYNAGRPIRSKITGRYINQKYVNKVKISMYKIKGISQFYLPFILGLTAFFGFASLKK